MNIKFCIALLLIAFLFCSCTGKPSKDDIKNKLLLEYVCMETATVNDLEITNTEDAEVISGAKGYVYTVSGEVEWKDGCNEFGMTPPGYKERFENKKVHLVKYDGAWR